MRNVFINRFMNMAVRVMRENDMALSSYAHKHIL